jgi:hypothetical protein
MQLNIDPQNRSLWMYLAPRHEENGMDSYAACNIEGTLPEVTSV